ncbi:MAG: HEAT repeat domain-containing protein, partial [Planctomycetota bacterium]
MRHFTVLPVLLCLLLPVRGEPARDLDVEVAAGSPLDWCAELPQPVPSLERTVPLGPPPGIPVATGRESKPAAGAAKKAAEDAVEKQPVRVRGRDAFSFARITTRDIAGHIKWGGKVEEESGRPARRAYPPPVGKDLLWLSVAVHLRRLLHPAAMNSTEAFEYLTYLGEPSLVACRLVEGEESLAGVVDRFRLYVSAIPRKRPEYVEGADPYETMMLRFTWDELVCAHPFSMDGRFAARLSLFGEEAVPWVVRASRSDHSFLHRNAILLLSWYRHPKALERLREVVRRDGDPVSRIRAVEGLVRRRDAGSVDLFMERLRRVHEGSFRLALVRGLGILGDRRAIPAIVKIANVSLRDFDILTTCLTALVRLAPKEDDAAVVALLDKVAELAFEDPDPVYAPDNPDPPETRNDTVKQLCLMLKTSMGWGGATRDLVLKTKALLSKAGGTTEFERLRNEFRPLTIHALLHVLGGLEEAHPLLAKVAANRNEDFTVR